MLSLDWNLVWTIINLIVLYLLMKKFLIGPVLGIMEKRKEWIAAQLSEAEGTKAQAEQLKEQYETVLAGAKEESNQILEEARARAEQKQKSMVHEANAQAAQILEHAKKTAEKEREAALLGAKEEIAGLALAAAKQLLLNGDQEQSTQMLYEQFIAEAGGTDDPDSN